MMSWLVNNVDITNADKLSLLPVLDVMATIHFALDERIKANAEDLSIYKKRYQSKDFDSGLNMLCDELKKLNEIFFVDSTLYNGNYDGLTDFPRLETVSIIEGIQKKIKKQEPLKNIIWEIINFLKRLIWIMDDALDGSLKIWFDEIHDQGVSISATAYNTYSNYLPEKSKAEMMSEAEGLFLDKISDYEEYPDKYYVYYNRQRIGCLFTGNDCGAEIGFNNFSTCNFNSSFIHFTALKKRNFPVDIYALIDTEDVTTEVVRWKPNCLNFVDTFEDIAIDSIIGDKPAIPKSYPNNGIINGDIPGHQSLLCGWWYGYGFLSTRLLLKPDFVFM